MSGWFGEALAGVALAALVVWILRPLNQPRRRMATPADDRWRELSENKQQLYRSILDLEFDQSVGKVSDSDYVFLRRQHELEALAILTEMDTLATSRDGTGATAVAEGGREPAAETRDNPESIETRLEAEIAAARERLRPQTGHSGA